MLSVLKLKRPKRSAMPDDAAAAAPFDDSRIAVALGALADADWSIEIDGEGPVYDAMRTLRRALVATDRRRLECAVTHAIQAAETMAAVSFVVGDVRETAENTQVIAAAVEEMDAAVNDIASTGNAVVMEAQEAGLLVESGRAAIDSAVTSMDEIQGAAADAGSRVDQLTAAIHDIAKVLGLIEAISKQTNLLALNATIEAARAGEAGRGFAVVAGEVKQLANQTAHATDQIRNRMAAILADIDQLAGAMTATRGVIDHGRSAMTRVAEQIGAMATTIGDVSQRMSQTAAAVTQQSAAVGEVSRSLHIIQEKTERSRANAERVIAAVRESDRVLEADLAELSGRNLPDAIVDLAKSDHAAWKRRLAGMLIGTAKLEASELTDHHSCRLGRWYDRMAEARLGANPSFRQLEEPHRAVHTHGKRAAELFAQGNREGAFEEYDKMEAASRTVIILLDALKQDLMRATPVTASA